MLYGSESNGLHHLASAKSETVIAATSTNNIDDFQRVFSDVRFEQWHQRLGHRSHGVVKTVLDCCNVRIPRNKGYSLCKLVNLVKVTNCLLFPLIQSTLLFLILL